MSSRTRSGPEARGVTVGSIWVGWVSCFCLGAAILGANGCGETRALEVFPKKAPPTMPPPEPPEPCGELDKCPPDRKHCFDETCVACVSDEHCMSDKAVCAEQVCVECRTDEQCPKDKVCHVEVGRCTEPCSDVALCKDKNRGVCDLQRGLCVQCIEGMGCGDHQVCDVVQSTCVACLMDDDCPDGGVCDGERQECTRQERG